MDKKSIRGLLDAASQDEIVVDGTTVPKAQVVRVSQHKTSRRVSNGVALGLLGGLVGAGIGRFGISCAETNDGCRNALLGTIGLAAAGAVAGAWALPDMVEVYRVKKITSPGTAGHSE